MSCVFKKKPEKPHVTSPGSARNRVVAFSNPGSSSGDMSPATSPKEASLGMPLHHNFMRSSNGGGGGGGGGPSRQHHALSVGALASAAAGGGAAGVVAPLVSPSAAAALLLHPLLLSAAGTDYVVSPQEIRALADMYEAYRLHEDKDTHIYDMLRKVSDPLHGEPEDINAALAAIGHREGNVLTLEELVLYANSTKQRALAELSRTRLSSRQQTTLDAFTMLGGGPDGTGCIMLNVLIATLQSFKLTVNVDALREVLDKDGNGQVDFEEFSWFYNEALAGNALSAAHDPTPTLRHEATKTFVPSNGAGVFGADMSVQFSMNTTESHGVSVLMARAKKLQRRKKKKEAKHAQQQLGDSALSLSMDPSAAPGDDDDEYESGGYDGYEYDGGDLLFAGGDGSGGGAFNATEVMRKLQAAVQSHRDNADLRRGIAPGHGGGGPAGGRATPSRGTDAASSASSATKGKKPVPPLLTQRSVGSAPVSRSTAAAETRTPSQLKIPSAPKQPPPSTALVAARQRPASAATPSPAATPHRSTMRLVQPSHDALLALSTSKRQADAKVTLLQQELQRRMAAAQAAMAELAAAQKEQGRLHDLLIGEMHRLRHMPKPIVAVKAGSREDEEASSTIRQTRAIVAAAAAAAADSQPPTTRTEAQGSSPRTQQEKPKESDASAAAAATPAVPTEAEGGFSPKRSENKEGGCAPSRTPSPHSAGDGDYDSDSFHISTSSGSSKPDEGKGKVVVAAPVAAAAAAAPTAERRSHSSSRGNSSSSSRRSASRSPSSRSSRSRSTSTSTRRSSSAASSAALLAKKPAAAATTARGAAAAVAGRPTSSQGGGGSSPRKRGVRPQPSVALRVPPKHVAPVTPRALRVMKSVGQASEPRPVGTIRRGRTKEVKEDEILQKIVEEHEKMSRSNAEKSAAAAAAPSGDSNASKKQSAASLLDPARLKQRNPYLELSSAAASHGGPGGDKNAKQSGKTTTSAVKAADGDSNSSSIRKKNGSEAAAAQEQMKMWTRGR